MRGPTATNSHSQEQSMARAVRGLPSRRKKPGWRTGGNMEQISRRSILRGALAVAASGALARPHLANAQAKTATVWQAQGFVPQEDDAFKKLVADYEKASGNHIE